MKIQLLKKLPYTVQTIHPKEILNHMPIKNQPIYKKTYLIACSLLSFYCGSIYADAVLDDASRFLNRATFGATSKDILLLSQQNTGNKTIDAMHHNCQFVKITNSGLKESHPHSISITSESPNYSTEN